MNGWHGINYYYIVCGDYCYKVRSYICNTFLQTNKIMKAQLQAYLHYTMVYIQSNITLISIRDKGGWLNTIRSKTHI